MGRLCNTFRRVSSSYLSVLTPQLGRKCDNEILTNTVYIGVKILCHINYHQADFLLNILLLCI